MRVLTLFLVLYSGVALADEAEDARFDKTCSRLLNGASVFKIEQPKAAYCKAAQTARHASKADGVVSKVWMGVAGVCATACVTTIGVALPSCNVSNLAASGTAAIVTHDFEALASAGMTLATTEAAAKADAKAAAAAKADAKAAAGKAKDPAEQDSDGAGATEDPIASKDDSATPATTASTDTPAADSGGFKSLLKKGKGRSLAACATAGLAAKNAYSKKKSSDQHHDEFVENLKSAEEFKIDAKLITVDSGAGDTVRASGRAPTEVVRDAKMAADCSDPSAEDAMGCAVNRDPALANLIAHAPKLAEDVKKAAKKEQGDFFSLEFSRTGGGVSVTTGKALDGGAAPEPAKEQKKVEQNNGESSMYASKGSSGEKAAAEEEAAIDPLTALFGVRRAKQGNDTLAFGQRGPASTPSSEFGPFQDGIGPAAGYSLFQRVSLRYVNVYRYGMW